MAANDRPSVENRDGNDPRPVVLELEGDAVVLYDPENPRAWIETTAAADVVP